MIVPLLLIIVVLLAAAKDDNVTYTLVLNETPVAGQPITFTATYPQSARQKYGPRQHNNPQVELVCDGKIINVVPMASEKKNTDGSWTGISYQMMIPLGALTCSAVVYSYDKAGLIAWATTYFEVGG